MTWDGTCRTGPDRHDVHDVAEALDALGIAWTGDPSDRIESSCPVHLGASEDGFNAWVNPESGKLLLTCWSGCTFMDMIDALDLRYVGGRPPRPHKPVAVRVGGPVYLIQPGRRIRCSDNLEVVGAALPGADVVQVRGRDLGGLGRALRGRQVWLISNNTPLGHVWRAEATAALRNRTGALYDVIIPHETPSALQAELGDDGFRAALQDALQDAALRGPVGTSVPRAPLAGGPEARRTGGPRGGRGKDPQTPARRRQRALRAIRGAGAAGMSKRDVWNAVGRSASAADVNGILAELETERLVHVHHGSGGRNRSHGTRAFIVDARTSLCADPACRRLFAVLPKPANDEQLRAPNVAGQRGPEAQQGRSGRASSATPG